ncbi:GFA family protein [Frigidibacter sp. RF13]|uniref:GFA family protein n=1 Tax=Frigidibacter sp. RF13 TaxID=2997340 RepID=UPI00226E5457|nr:GFA family protein [Frigidibacter sp. RF13]MCY1128243.1 GFA family protein [Frigidibacter sp. RF13]
MTLPEITRPHRATCHCGAVELEVSLVEGGLSTARRCDCSYCRRRGAIAVSAPLDGLRVIRGADKLSLYQWGTKTAKHYFCSVCGIYTHHQRRSNPNEYGVNAASLDGLNPRDLGDVKWSDGVNHPSDRPAR